MPKRRSPWGDDIPLQMKTHISPREVAFGVDGVKYRNQIHGNTKDLLLRGAKQFYSKPPPPSNEPRASHEANNNNHRTITSFFPSTKPSSEKRTKAKLLGTSFCCHSSGKVSCYFCEKVTCSYCGGFCDICGQLFCSLCSIKSYDQEDVSVCLSCTT